MSRQTGISFEEFRQRFQAEEAYEAFLFEQHWPEGFVCPKCGWHGCYRLRGRHEYVCKQCRRQSSVTAGTVLHRTHLPLTVWFWAIYLIVRDKRGISASQLSRELEIAYSSAWYLLHRLCSAMGERDKNYVLFGVIELDDAYFGAPSFNGKRGRGTDKISALAAVSLTDEGHPLFLKIQVSRLDAESVRTITQQTVCSGSEIHSDALGSFRAALQGEYVHHYQVFDLGQQRFALDSYPDLQYEVLPSWNFPRHR